MLFLNHTAETVATNLAIDEWLLSQAEGRETADEILRLWHLDRPFVVIGRSSRVADEVNLPLAERDQIPVLRRVSGGASVAAGYGCLFYSVLLSLEKRPGLAMIDKAHQFVMGHLLDALQPMVPTLKFQGTCDLTLNGRKCSGNSLRVQRKWMLYHGTLLLEMDLAWIDQILLHPPREPDYRQSRSHRDFLTNLNLPSHQVADAVRRVWNAEQNAMEMDNASIEHLIASKYSQTAWNFQR